MHWLYILNFWPWTPFRAPPGLCYGCSARDFPGGCLNRKELQLSSNVTDALVGDLAALTNLRELSLRGCTGLTGAPGCGFGRLAALQHLEVLDVSSCNALQVRRRLMPSCM